jgi:DNA-binding transcriptional ArsR family regulator
MEMKPAAQTNHVSDDCCQVFSVNHSVVSSIKATLPDLSAVAALYKALADESRCTLLAALCLSDELCVCDLAEITQVSMPTASHHLRKLKDQNLVASRREGKLVFYRLQGSEARTLLDIAIKRQAVLG